MTNIALIVLDTLRKDAFEKHFDWLPGQYFTNAYSTSHWTVPAHASLFTGKYASEVGVYAGKQHLDCEKPVLAELLCDAGYTTRAFSTNVNVSSIFGFDRGFEQFVSLGRHNRQLRQITDESLFDWTKYSGENSNILTYLKAIKDCVRSDCDTVPSIRSGIDLKFDLRNRFGKNNNDMGAQSVLDRIRTVDFGEQEFLFLNLMEAHSPYEVPESYLSVDEYESPDNPAGEVTDGFDTSSLQKRYDSAVRYLSDIYQKIFEQLSDEFDVIITVSDHGELLGEHGYCGHSMGLYPQLTHVPLSIYPHTGEAPIKTPVSISDICQTVLDTAEIPHEASRGSNLQSDSLESKHVLTEYHGLPHPDRTVESFRNWTDSDAAIQTYQQWKRGIVLPNGCYGYETHDGFNTEGSCENADPQSELATAVELMDIDRTDSQETNSIPESVEKELQHLGYL